MSLHKKDWLKLGALAAVASSPWTLPALGGLLGVGAGAAGAGTAGTLALEDAALGTAMQGLLGNGASGALGAVMPFGPTAQTIGAISSIPGATPPLIPETTPFFTGAGAADKSAEMLSALNGPGAGAETSLLDKASNLNWDKGAKGLQLANYFAQQGEPKQQQMATRPPVPQQQLLAETDLEKLLKRIYGGMYG